MKLAVIGLGKMGTTLIKGILYNGILNSEQIIGCSIDVEEKESNPAYEGIKTIPDNRKGAEEADIILLAVKPQVMDIVLNEIKVVVPKKLVISIAAGVSLTHLDRILPSSCRIVRVMPNMPAMVREGISAVTLGEGTTEEDKEIVFRLLNGVGEVIEVEEELMNAITGLSGSGPAYAYIMIEALADGGVLTGLSREQSLRLAARTMLGAAKMVLETGKHPGELKDMVTSPGGTAIRGIEVLENHGVRGILIDAVKKATERSRELD